MTPGSPVIKAQSRSKVNKPSGVRLGRRVGKLRVGRQEEPRSRQPAKRKRAGGVKLRIRCTRRGSTGRRWERRPCRVSVCGWKGPHHPACTSGSRCVTGSPCANPATSKASRGSESDTLLKGRVQSEGTSLLSTHKCPQVREVSIINVKSILVTRR